MLPPYVNRSPAAALPQGVGRGRGGEPGYLLPLQVTSGHLPYIYLN